jgi:hypothetical protein
MYPLRRRGADPSYLLSRITPSAARHVIPAGATIRLHRLPNPSRYGVIGTEGLIVGQVIGDDDVGCAREVCAQHHDHGRTLGNS